MRSRLNEAQRSTLYCVHLSEANKAKLANQFALITDIPLSEFEALLKDEEDIQSIKQATRNECITVYTVPGDNLIVPSLLTACYEAPLDYIHVKSHKCTLSYCKEKKSKLHTLGEISKHQLKLIVEGEFVYKDTTDFRPFKSIQTKKTNWSESQI